MNDQARSWIGFNLVKGIGPVRLTKLLEYFGDVGTAWTAEPSELRAAGLRSDLIDKVMGVRRGSELDRILEKLRDSRVKLLTWDDPGYPSSLQDIPRSPPVLYLRGSLGEEDHRAAAVVGTRRCTAYGRQAAEDSTAP